MNSLDQQDALVQQNALRTAPTPTAEQKEVPVLSALPLDHVPLEGVREERGVGVYERPISHSMLAPSEHLKVKVYAIVP